MRDRRGLGTAMRSNGANLNQPAPNPVAKPNLTVQIQSLCFRIGRKARAGRGKWSQKAQEASIWRAVGVLLVGVCTILGGLALSSGMRQSEGWLPYFNKEGYFYYQPCANNDKFKIVPGHVEVSLFEMRIYA